MNATLITSPYVPPARPLLIAGNGGQPKLLLRSADGASAEIYLHGGQVTSWRPASGEERLFLSESADFGEEAAIRGGVPVIFPQFGPDGRLPRHGFARNTEWELYNARVSADGAATVILRLTDSRASWALWRHRFSLELKVAVAGQRLELVLRVANEGRKAYRFTAALHTYLRVLEAARCQVMGLRECRYRDQLSGVEAVAEEIAPNLNSEIDRIYFDAPTSLRVQEPGRVLEVQKSGFPDVVVWNPGPIKAAAMADLEPGGDRRMLCVEPALIGKPVLLAPGESWSGSQVLVAGGAA